MYFALIKESVVLGSIFRSEDFDSFTRFEVHRNRKYYF